MAEDKVVPEVDDNIARSVGEDPSAVKEAAAAKAAPPSYRVMTETKIPISSQRGKLWQSRIKQGQKKQKPFIDAYHEANRYYTNDQSPHRSLDEPSSSGNSSGGTISDESKETENVVFANVMAMTPRIYAQNPEVEITCNTKEVQYDALATMCERLMNVIALKTTQPGLNLKPKAKKAIVCTQLGNLVWSEVDFVKKEESSEQAMSDIAQLGEELAKAKDKKEIEAIEGKLMAIDQRFDILQPSGPKLNILGPDRVIADTAVNEVDFTDAMWMAKWDFLPTMYLQARFMEKDAEGRQVLSFAPTHIVSVGETTGGVDDEINNFSLYQEDDSSKYGYKDKDTFDQAKRTKVWWIWDKVTRRLELYMDNDWKWPLWVWNDPLNLDGFFPFKALYFVIPSEGAFAKGEVSYYLDQQDAINEINEQERLSRQWAKWNIWFNSNAVDDATVSRILEGGKSRGAYGVALPEGMKIDDVLKSILPPSANFASLFNKETKYQAIDRISSVNDAARGSEFKTNTTNGAIAKYEQNSNIVLEDKIDALEDWLSEVYWQVLQLCLQFMQKDQVVSLIGATQGGQWTNMDAKQISQTISFRIVAGSTQKPTSKAKKEEAVAVSQVLGQFASVSPMALILSLKVFERAFDEVEISQEEWAELRAQMSQQFGVGGPNGPAAPEAGQPGDGQVDPEMVKQFVAQLPPQVQQKIAQLIQGGADPVAAIKQVTGTDVTNPGTGQQQQAPAA